MSWRLKLQTWVATANRNLGMTPAPRALLPGLAAHRKLGKSAGQGYVPGQGNVAFCYGLKFRLAGRFASTVFARRSLYL
jgi:hypothetical protein